MQTIRSAVIRSWGFSLSLLALSACATVAGLMNTEALVANGFAEGLKSYRQSAAVLATASAKPIAVAESEEFWLGHARIAGAEPVSSRKPLTIGDRMTISSGGEDRVLEVVDVGPLDTTGTHIVSGAIEPRLLAVTCRDVKFPDGARTRFIIEADDAGLPASPMKRQSAL